MSDNIEISEAVNAAAANLQNVAINVKPGEKIMLTITIISVPEVEDPDMPPSLKVIAERVCRTNGITMHDLSGKSRADGLPCLRHLYCHVAHVIYGHSKKDTGKKINKDRTTVGHSIEVYKNLKGTQHPKMMQYIACTQTAFNVKL